MELEGGMAALGSEVSPALFHEGSVSIMLQSKEFENMIRKCYVTNRGLDRRQRSSCSHYVNLGGGYYSGRHCGSPEI